MITFSIYWVVHRVHYTFYFCSFINRKLRLSTFFPLGKHYLILNPNWWWVPLSSISVFHAINWITTKSSHIKYAFPKIWHVIFGIGYEDKTRIRHTLSEIVLSSWEMMHCHIQFGMWEIPRSVNQACCGCDKTNWGKIMSCHQT